MNYVCETFPSLRGFFFWQPRVLLHMHIPQSVEVSFLFKNCERLFWLTLVPGFLFFVSDICLPIAFLSICVHICLCKANEALRKFSFACFFFQPVHHNSLFPKIACAIQRTLIIKGLHYLPLCVSWCFINHGTCQTNNHTRIGSVRKRHHSHHLSPVHSFVYTSECRPKWGPLNFGYHDVSLCRDRCGKSLLRQSCSRNNVLEPVGKLL